MATGLKSINIDPDLHEYLKNNADRIGMKFRAFIEQILEGKRDGEGMPVPAKGKKS